MKRLNKIAKRITASDELTEQFITECEHSGKLTNDQMFEICRGFRDGLTIEEVKVYAKPEFNKQQMKEIRRGFERGLSMEQVKIFVKPEINAKQMEKIRLDFQEGLTIEEVKEKYNL